MRKLLYILGVVSIIGIFGSCKKEFLNLKPLKAYSDADVWLDPNLAAAFVSDVYNRAEGYPYAMNRLSDLVDETTASNANTGGTVAYLTGLVSQDNFYGFANPLGSYGMTWGLTGVPFPQECNHFTWASLFKNVRNCNIFFSKINGVKFPTDAAKTTMIGEMYFLRGWNYHFLVAGYGGVPIITSPYDLSADFSIARNTYEECINYIVSQFDSAAMYLPATVSGDLRGHATKGAALAMKSRTLLYAASDLHNNMSVYAPGFSNPALLGYTTGTQTARWTAAKAAAKAVIDLGTFSLVNPTPAPADSAAKNLNTYFLSYGYTTEDIFVQYFSIKTGVAFGDYNPGLFYGTNGYHNWGFGTPLSEMVDDYEMKDGTAFDWSNPVEAANPYAKRDARFYASIMYEGLGWRKRPADIVPYDPFDKLQLGHVYALDGTTMKVAGIDTREGAIENWNGGFSNYYMRKFVDPAIDGQYNKQDIPFRHIRYAEVLLNYAEACIEENTGSDLVDARTYINMIRTRAGQPNIAAGLSQAALRTIVRHERRIELAFEEHRFWDVRRWMIGTDVYHQYHKIDVAYKTASAATKYRQADGSTWSAPVYSNKNIPTLPAVWSNKYYYFPILRDEMNKNPKLVENPGY